MSNEIIKPPKEVKDWQTGLKVAIQLSGWLFAPLITALFLGRWLDQRFGTAPGLFLATTGIAFIITIIGMIIQASRFVRAAELEIKKHSVTKPEDHYEQPSNGKQ